MLLHFLNFRRHFPVSVLFFSFNGFFLFALFFPLFPHVFAFFNALPFFDSKRSHFYFLGLINYFGDIVYFGDLFFIRPRLDFCFSFSTSCCVVWMGIVELGMVFERKWSFYLVIGLLLFQAFFVFNFEFIDGILFGLALALLVSYLYLKKYIA